MQDYLDENDCIIKFILEASDHLKLTALVKASACILYHKAIRKQRRQKTEDQIDKHVRIFILYWSL